MGHTHYWRGQTNFTPEFVSDVEMILDRSQINLAGPSGTGKPEVGLDGIALNGAESADEDYETFALDAGDIESNFCKTGHRPYDLVVTTILLRAAHYSEALTVRSDGRWDSDDWESARTYYTLLFGEEPAKPNGL